MSEQHQHQAATVYLRDDQMNAIMEKLRLLDQLEHLQPIRASVGFLAAVVFLSVVVGVLIGVVGMTA